jgi:hypothetical protein
MDINIIKLKDVLRVVSKALCLLLTPPFYRGVYAPWWGINKINILPAD